VTLVLDPFDRGPLLKEEKEAASVSIFANLKLPDPGKVSLVLFVRASEEERGPHIIEDGGVLA